MFIANPLRAARIAEHGAAKTAAADRAPIDLSPIALAGDAGDAGVARPNVKDARRIAAKRRRGCAVDMSRSHESAGAAARRSSAR